MTAGVFTFEAQGADLKLLPLAARRALDVSGWKLSLAGWTSLSQFDRHALVAYGTAERIDTSAVEALVRLATPSATPIDASIEGALEECDDRAARLLHPYRVLASAWPGLSRLSRFALRHLAKRGDAERLAVAFDEVVGRALQLTHLDSKGEARMVDVGEKGVTKRRAVARARVKMLPKTALLVVEHGGPKGDVLASARIAGIMASKRTSDLIPLCHPIALSHVALELTVDPEAGVVTILATTETWDRTGVEMEAMVAVSVAALTVYDMLKGAQRDIAIEDVVLLEKEGGRSGHYVRTETLGHSAAPTPREEHEQNEGEG